MKTFKEIREACWKGYKQVGTKKKGGKDVPNCVPEETIEEAKKIQDIARKYKRELQKIQKSGNLELSKKAEAELYQWASSNGEIRGDEEDEFWNWIDKNVDDLIKGKIKEGVREGVYTKNDGGAFDGLRIAKWLANEDGKSWRKLKYGDTDSYLRAAADLLKQDKAKAKSILSKPTPRD